MESFQDRSIQVGKKIRAYVNLHKQGWFSIVDMETGLVCGYAQSCLIKDAVFYVSDKGRERVRKSGRKLVHAWVRGIYMGSDIEKEECSNALQYNPYYHKGFTDQNGHVVEFAELALLKDKKVYVRDEEDEHRHL